MEEIESPFLSKSQRRNSAILLMEGLETECPFSLHQPLYTSHFFWYNVSEDCLLHNPTLLATFADMPEALAKRWRVSKHEDEAMLGAGGIAGPEVASEDPTLEEGRSECPPGGPEGPETIPCWARMVL